MADAWVCRFDAVGQTYRGRPVFSDVGFVLPVGSRVGVVGRNAAGKSTLLRLMAGLEAPASGRVTLAPGVSVRALPQEPHLDEDTTVLSTVQQAVSGDLADLHRFREIGEMLAVGTSDASVAELGELQQRLDRRAAWDLDARLTMAMDALRCPPPDTPVRSLSGGQRRRVALCRLLMQQPNLLLLDEPTNHLDVASVAWLERHLAGYPGTVVAVTHDRYFLDRTANWIVELDRGHAYTYPGTYATYLAAKASRLTDEGRRDARRRRQLSDELAWITTGAVGRRASSGARIRAYEERAAAAEYPHRLDPDQIHIPPGPRLGNRVVEVEHLTKAIYGLPLVNDLSFTLPRGAVAGLVGPNGSGKTTLLRLIAGLEPPVGGWIHIGETVRIAYVDQARVAVESDRPAWQLVSDGADTVRLGNADLPARAYLAAFGFRGQDQSKPARLMSGGERNRLNLALTLVRGGNLLLLDEPTNDLDIEALSSLERAVDGFPGCVMVSTHDRWFLDRVATHVLAWEGTSEHPGRWRWFEGNFAAYRETRPEHSDTGDAPAASVHRRLTRG